jgi:hypothetical protein
MLLDLAVIGLLITAAVVLAVRLRPSRVAGSRGVLFRRTLFMRTRFRRAASLAAVVSVLVIFVLVQVRFMISSDGQGRPAPAQVAGTWVDGEGATLTVQPDGHFTAAGLPADASDPAGDGQPHPANGNGTWQITRGDGSWYVLFTESGGAQFSLAMGQPSWPGGASSATFSYVFARYDAVDTWSFSRDR